jgi:hypothetical protein
MNPRDLTGGDQEAGSSPPILATLNQSGGDAELRATPTAASPRRPAVQTGLRTMGVAFPTQSNSAGRAPARDRLHRDGRHHSANALAFGASGRNRGLVSILAKGSPEQQQLYAPR